MRQQKEVLILAIPEIENLWAGILAEIQGEIGWEKVQQWLVPTQPLVLQGSRLTVQVPNYYFRYWIEENFIELIETTARRQRGQELFVDLVIAPSVSAALTASLETPGAPLPRATEPGVRPTPVPATLEQPTANHPSPGGLSPGAGFPLAGAGAPRANPLHPSRQMPSDFAPAPEANGGLILNLRYTFDNFVIGNNNRFAHAAALAVADNPSTYNPLFIYGSSGLGKTHLMQAIGHFVKAHRPATVVAYVSSEKFTNELIASIGQGSSNVNQFRSRYRNIDILLIDDIQFLAGKERTQEEFFHTFNALHESGKQIVITSDRPPKDLPQLEERLRSRFEWGLTCDIQKPDMETRTAILQNKAISDQLDISIDILTYIARKIDTNIRELEGVLNRVVMYSRAYSESIDADLVDKVLKDTNPELSRSRVNVGQILDVVSIYYGISLQDLKSKKRTQEIVLPRQIAMYLCQQLMDISFPRLGEEFGGRDHTTVMYACNKINDRIKEDRDFALVIKELKNKIEAR